MRERLVLFPNLGAEDERPLSVVAPDFAAALASTWACLFDGRAELTGARARPSWMSDDDAAFPFLSGAEGLVPWLSTTTTQGLADELGLAHTAPLPVVARTVGDKAWALHVAREERLLPPPLHEVLTAFEPSDLDGPRSRAVVDERLASWPASLSESFTLKPRFGSSGRGRVKGRGGRLDDDGARALPRLAQRGGAILEPWLQRSEDLSAQLFLDDSGAVSLLGTTRQRVSASGVWQGNALVLEENGAVHSGSSFDDEVRAAALVVGKRAAAAGFRGCLGIDAFAYRGGDGAALLRPLVEVNARFTMGIVALGLARRAAIAGELHAGEVCCYRPAPVDIDLPARVRALECPAGALYLAASYEALGGVLLGGTAPTGGKPKRR